VAPVAPHPPVVFFMVYIPTKSRYFFADLKT